MADKDGAMLRFLYAILKQMNLRNIDWNQVARDPGLSQPISNGHAARMRYSRFKATMEPNEVKRPKHTVSSKNRVTKSKKDPRANRNHSLQSGAASALGMASVADLISPSATSLVKQERLHNTYDARLTPGLTPAPVLNVTTPTTSYISHSRFLTPCSDTDGYASSPAPTSTPTSDVLHTQQAFDFPASDYSQDMLANWQQTVCPPYQPPFAFDPFTIDCSHQQQMQHRPEELCVPYRPQTQGSDSGNMNMKREAYGSPCL